MKESETLDRRLNYGDSGRSPFGGNSDGNQNHGKAGSPRHRHGKGCHQPMIRLNPLGEGVDDRRHFDYQRLECRIHRIGNRIHRTFHCGKQKAECAAESGIHLLCRVRRNSFHILELGQHRIQFIGIRRQRQSGK